MVARRAIRPAERCQRSSGICIQRAGSLLGRRHLQSGEAIAKNMEAACQNDNIGYCQGHRGTATAAAKPYDYDLSKVNTAVETDCSELVRCCVLYAGIHVNSFSTANEVAALRQTGQFDILEKR